MYSLSSTDRSDYPTLLSIWEASVRSTHHFLAKDDIDFFKETIHEKNIFDLVSLTVVKDTAHSIVGFMGVAGDSLEMIFLHPSIIGKGVGKLLLQHAVDKLKITKVDVNEQNLDAVEFYKRFGFEVVSRSELDGTGKPYPILHMQLK